MSSAGEGGGGGRRRRLSRAWIVGSGLVLLVALVLGGVVWQRSDRSSSSTSSSGTSRSSTSSSGTSPSSGSSSTAGPSSGSSSAADPSTDRPASTVRYVAPQASGTGDGTSWSDAAQLQDLPRLMGQVRNGGQIWLRADTGPFQVTGKIDLASGGLAGAPVVVRGVDGDGQPAAAVIEGNRTSPYDPHGDPGKSVFDLGTGAAHLTFQDLAFSNVGNVFLAGGDVTDLLISDVTATNVRRFFTNSKADGVASAVVSDLTIRRVTVQGFSKRVLELRYGSHDVLLEDVVGDSDHQDGDDFAMGVHLMDTVHDVTFRRVTMRNIQDTLEKYWNGDGFATERGVHDITFDSTTSSGNTDAGYDLKSSRTTLTGVTSTDNKRNFRLWGQDVTVRGATVTDPHKRGGISSQAQFWIGDDARVQIQDSTVRDASPDTVVFDLEPGAQLTVTGGEIAHAGTLQKLQKGATVALHGVSQ